MHNKEFGVQMATAVGSSSPKQSWGTIISLGAVIVSLILPVAILLNSLA